MKPARKVVPAWCGRSPHGKLMVNTAATHRVLTRMALCENVGLSWASAKLRGYTVARVKVEAAA